MVPWAGRFRKAGIDRDRKRYWHVTGFKKVELIRGGGGQWFQGLVPGDDGADLVHLGLDDEELRTRGRPLLLLLSLV
jgi:hypothetical protein